MTQIPNRVSLMRARLEERYIHLAPKFKGSIDGAILVLNLPFMGFKLIKGMGSSSSGLGNAVVMFFGFLIVATFVFVSLLLLPFFGFWAFPTVFLMVVFAGAYIGYHFPDNKAP